MAKVHSSLHPSGLSPTTSVLRHVAELWNGQQTGIFRCAWGKAQLIAGEPREDEDLSVLMRALYQGGHTEFRGAESFASAPPPRLGAVLWECARRVARAQDLRPATELEPSPGVKRPQDLPLDPKALSLLRGHADTALMLRSLVGLPKVQRRVVLADLAILVAMGLVRPKLPRSPEAAAPALPASFSIPEPAPEPAPEAPRPKRRKPEPERPTRIGGSKQLELLTREVELTDDADDYTVLGIARSTDGAGVERAVERLLNRYGEVLDDASVGREARELARTLLKRVRDAAERVRAGSARTRTDGVNALTAFDDGCAALERGRVGDALRYLAIARQREPFNPRVTAWLGAAVMRDSNRDPSSRRKKGLALIEEASSLGCTDADLLLARIDIEDGDLVRAWARLDAAVSRDPSHAEARALLIQVQKDVKSD